MKFSEAWLREFVNPPITSLELADQLTIAGIEVDHIIPAYTQFDGLVIAEIKSVSKIAPFSLSS